MKISPYLSFNGNCADALAFYEKAFHVKADIMRYKDAPAENFYQSPEGTENFVLHAQFELGGESIMLSDCPPEYPVTLGNNITITLEFDDAAAATAVFDALKEDGEIHMELQETFWSKCFGSLTDKFGISWNISTNFPS